MRKDLIILLLLVATISVSFQFRPAEHLYLLEDDDFDNQSFSVNHDDIPELGLEYWTADDWHKTYGHRLSKRGSWSLSVGDEVARFDEALGFPVHVRKVNPSTVLASYRNTPDWSRGFMIYAYVNLRTGRAAGIAVSRYSLQSIHNGIGRVDWTGPPSPGFWVSGYR